MSKKVPLKDAKDLWNEASTFERTSIAIHNGGNFIQSLTEASNAFVDYRYLYNGKEPNENYDLSFPMQFVKNVIIQKRPDFVNP